MTTPTTSRVFTPLGVLGTLLVAAAAVVLLVPLAVPAGSAHAELRGFVAQLLGAATLLSFAFFALVSAGDKHHQVQPVATKAAPRAAAQPAGAIGAAA